MVSHIFSQFTKKRQRSEPARTYFGVPFPNWLVDFCPTVSKPVLECCCSGNIDRQGANTTCLEHQRSKHTSWDRQMTDSTIVEAKSENKLMNDCEVQARVPPVRCIIIREDTPRGTQGEMGREREKEGNFGPHAVRAHTSGPHHPLGPDTLPPAPLPPPVRARVAQKLHPETQMPTLGLNQGATFNTKI